MTQLVGILGKAGAGKDTAADFLSQHHGHLKYSMAGPLKAMLNAGFGFAAELWADRDWKERVLPWLGKSPRQLAQTLGTEWGRDLVHADLWLLLAQYTWTNLATNERLLPQYRRMVIPDVRFPNEAQWILEQGGALIEIVRPGQQAVAAHISEQGLDAKLYPRTVVINDCGIATLQHRVEAALGYEHQDRR